MSTPRAVRSASIVLDGRIVAGDAARVSVLDRGFLHGDGVSETMRARGTIAFALEAHLTRLVASCRELSIEAPSLDSLRADAVLALLALGPSVPHAALRFQVTRGESGIGLDDFEPDGEPTVVAITRELAAPDRRLSVSAARASTPFSAPFPAKVIAYSATIRARAEARRRGKDDVLFVTPDGSVIEGGSSNVLAIVAGKLRAPRAGALAGITRGIALELAAELGCAVDEGRLSFEELLGAEDVFLTSSLRGIARVGSVEDTTLPAPGPLGDALRDAYHARFLRETTA